MACDDYCCNHGCNQGRDCPARSKPIRRTDPGIEGVFTIARNGIDRVIELERLLAGERELTQQLRGEAAVLAGLLRDCDLELAAIEAEDYRKGGEWVFLRAAIDIALNPINREGSLL